MSDLLASGVLLVGLGPALVMVMVTLLLVVNARRRECRRWERQLDSVFGAAQVRKRRGE